MAKFSRNTVYQLVEEDILAFDGLGRRARILYDMVYVALVNNWTADETLGWITPFEKRHGSTPDISALLCFHFYKKVYYLDSEETFPSTMEKAGYILGIAMNIGDALTFHILTDNHETVIARSVVRSAKPWSPANQRVLFDSTLDSAVRHDKANQNLELPDDFMLANTPLPNIGRKKRRCKISKKRLAKIADTAKLSDKLVPALRGLNSLKVASQVLLVRMFILLCGRFCRRA